MTTNDSDSETDSRKTPPGFETVIKHSTILVGDLAPGEQRTKTYRFDTGDSPGFAHEPAVMLDETASDAVEVVDVAPDAAEIVVDGDTATGTKTTFKLVAIGERGTDA